MSGPVRDVRNEGALRRGTGSATGPADEISSQQVIDPDGVLFRISNDGVGKHNFLGDGRQNKPILNATPASYSPGDYWLEQIAGSTKLVFVDAGGTPIIVGGTPGSLSPTVTALNNGFTTNLAAVVVDSIGSIEWSLTLYNPNSGERHGYRLWAAHNGTLIADATVADLNVQGTVAIGGLPVTLSLDLTGAGGTQEMELNALATSPGWFSAIIAERMTAA